MSNPFKKGDKVRTLVDIKDAYQEVWHEAGSVDEVTKIASDGEGLMFSTKLGTHYTNVEMVDPVEKSLLNKHLVLELKLHALVDQGKCDSEEADDLRDEMDNPECYWKLTEEQRDLTNKLSAALNDERDVREGKGKLTMRRYYKFTECNDWEGEEWNFYIPLTDEEVERVKFLITKNEDAYSLKDITLTEEEVDEIIKTNNDERYEAYYTAPHNKCSGINLPDKIDMEEDDPFYKGQCWVKG